ncbi:glycosyltransferase [Microbacterium telephonicum]|uniref:UDP:flavonoid glycosyltransferase YjiC (YdhE family) n=1 Tax=Microbacterium telephonicum TaxID=1714841 RepID=A0A498CCJ6_9MICO|nr:nucleotide disphospho-sugar-binding domain-containing protein [Microbacterium telephonicum]RLK52336.1 UDP:flavonoid glycosyltransferase YjiC (YdhE family) [Microbacterium telephonicum]
MTRYLLSVQPFTGHVNPVLAVAAELVARDHDVRVYTGQAFAAAVTASGARLVPWREAPDFDEHDLPATFPRLRGKKGMRQVLVNVVDVFIATAPAQARDLAAEYARQPWDVIAGDEMSLGAAFFAQREGTIWATICIIPLNLAGAQGPPGGLGLAPGTNPLTRTRDALLRAAVPVLSGPISGALRRARAEAGVAPSRAGLDHQAFSPHLAVAAGCRLLDYGRTDRPASLRFVGALSRPSTAPFDPPPWWGELDGPLPVVHVTQGTQNIDPDDLLRPAMEALAGEPVLVVATTGIRGRDELPFPVPANVRVAGFLPHAHLLPKIETMVTNGGWGGTLGALSRGIPLVVAGGDLDKPEVAARVAWSGAGVNLKTGTPTAMQVRTAVRRVRADPSYRAAAQRVAAQLEAAGGAGAAASALETLA